jgi:Tol biopolymer transport system component
MDTRSRLLETFAALIALVLAVALPVERAGAAYPGKAGPIAYNRYEDVAELNEENGLLEVHPEGGLFVHGPRQKERPARLTGEASDGEPAFSPNGRLVAFASTRGKTGQRSTSQLYLMRSDGTGLRQLTDDPAGAAAPYFSPDGRLLVFVRSHHLWLLRIASGAQRQLTFGPAGDGEPVFTPSGRRILFSSNRSSGGGRNDSSDIWAVGSDGRNPRVLVDEPGAEVSPEVSPDGRRIAFVVQQGSYYGYGNLRIARADGRILRSLDEKSGPQCRPCYGSPSWAPDGRHLATTEKSGNVGSTALIVLTPDGRHRRKFAAGAVSTEGTGGHVGAPAWGAVPQR